MTIATVHTPEELPAMLTMAHAQTFLGLSRPKTYELIHRRGFPRFDLAGRFECQGLRFYGGWRVRLGSHEMTTTLSGKVGTA